MKPFITNYHIENSIQTSIVYNKKDKHDTVVVSRDYIVDIRYHGTSTITVFEVTSYSALKVLCVPIVPNADYADQVFVLTY